MFLLLFFLRAKLNFFRKTAAQSSYNFNTHRTKLQKNSLEMQFFPNPRSQIGVFLASRTARGLRPGFVDVSLFLVSLARRLLGFGNSLPEVTFK